MSDANAPVSETSAVLNAKPISTTTCGNNPEKIQIEGASTDMPATPCGNTTSPDTIRGNEISEDVTKADQAPPDNTSKEDMNVSISRYYDILTPDEDDIISISHDDIISNKCEDSLEKLSNSDLDEIKAALWNQSEESNNSPSSLEEKPRKKARLRPQKIPSTARMRAQRIIDAGNAKIRRKEVLPHTYKPVPILPSKESIPPNMHDSSDDAIVYTLPSLSPPNHPKNKKGKAKFIIRTVGIQNYRDTETLVKANTQKCSFKYYLCQHLFP